MDLSARVGVVVFTALLVGSLFVGSAAAQADGGDEIDHLVDEYNANVDEAPSILTNRLAGEQVELRVGSGAETATADTGTAYRLAVGGDGRITASDTGDHPDATVRVLTSERTMNRMLHSDDPNAAFGSAYDAGEIEIEGVGVVNTAKVELAKGGVWVGRTLGLL